MSNQNSTDLYFKPTILPEQMIEMHEALVSASSEPSERKAALAIIEEYYNFFGRTGMRPDMWLLLTGALGNYEMRILNDPTQRHNLLFFYEFTLIMMDATWIVHRNKK